MSKNIGNKSAPRRMMLTNSTGEKGYQPNVYDDPFINKTHHKESSQNVDNSEDVQKIFEFVQNHHIKVIPCLKNKTSELSFKNATAKRDTLISWFLNSKEDRGVALPCGAINNVVVIDCDVKGEPNGVQFFCDLCSINGATPSKVYQDTPSGGRHYFYKYNEAINHNKTNLVIAGEKSNIDIKTDNGYVMIDPLSKRYKMQGNLKEAPELPEWLIPIITGVKHVYEINEDSAIGLAVEEIKKSSEGQRNDTLNKVAFWMGRYLSTSNIDMDVVMEALIEAGVSTGLDPKESTSSVKSGMGKGHTKGFFEDPVEMPRFLRKLTESESEAETETEEEQDDETQKKLPPAPIEVLDENLQLIIRELSNSKNVPIEIIFGIILALGSACLGRNRGIINDAKTRWVEVANLYFLVIAETGAGKSHAFDFVFHHLVNKEAENKRIWKEKRRKYEEDLMLWRKKKNNEEPMPEKPVNIQYLLDDATIEAAIERLEENPKGLFWTVDEFSGFFQGLDRYAKNGSGEGKRKLLSAWDSKGISLTRKTKDGISDEKYITKGTIGMFGNIQPFLFQSAFTFADVAQGWPQRFLYIRGQVERPLILPLPEIDSRVDILLEKITGKIMSLNMVMNERGVLDTKYLNISDDAREIYNTFINLLNTKTFNTNMAGYAAKMNRITLRLALILHFLEWGVSDEPNYADEISPKTMNSAVIVANWFMAHTERVHTMLPDGTNKKTSKEVPIGERKIAELIVKYAPDIMAMDGVIENSVWSGWQKEAGLIMSNQAINECLKKLGVTFGRTKTTRYKVITPKVIQACSKKTVVMNTILTTSDEED